MLDAVTNGPSSLPAHAQQQDHVVRRATAYIAKVPGVAGDADGDKKILKVAQAMVHGFGLTKAKAADLLTVHYNPRCQPPRTDNAIQQIVDSAAKAPSPKSPGWMINNANSSKAGSTGSSAPVLQVPTGSSPRNTYTELGSAERMIAQHGANIRYCSLWKAFLIWDGHRWRRDESNQVVHMATKTVRTIYAEAAQEPDAETRKHITRYAQAAESWSHIKAMIDLVKGLPPVPVMPAELDRDQWALNCENGTIDLKTGHLRPHRREDLITKIIPVAYDPNGICPAWGEFLDSIMGGNRDLIDYLRRLTGYCLTGSTAEQVIHVFFGAGQNGKSTWCNTVLNLLSDYGTQAPPQLLISKKFGGEQSNDVAELFGKRLIIDSEVEEGRSFNVAKTKQLTGGDKVKARRLYENFFEFDMTGKIIMAVNHKPQIKEDDKGTWRRFRLVPFVVTIPDNQIDRTLPAKLKSEFPGILAWAVRGCMEWQQQGLVPPKDVELATQSYRQEMDAISEFFDECCVTGDDELRVGAGDLYKAYVSWCEARGEHPMSQKLFGPRVMSRAKGKEKCPTTRRVVYIGVELRTGEIGADCTDDDCHAAKRSGGSDWEDELMLMEVAGNSSDRFDHFVQHSQMFTVPFGGDPEVQKQVSSLIE